MSRSLIRAEPWTIGPDRTPGASGPIRRTECTTCHDESPPSDGQKAPDLWALEHAGLSGHTGFREIVTAFLRAVPARGNPLYVEEATGP